MAIQRSQPEVGRVASRPTPAAAGPKQRNVANTFASRSLPKRELHRGVITSAWFCASVARGAGEGLEAQIARTRKTCARRVTCGPQLPGVLERSIFASLFLLLPLSKSTTYIPTTTRTSTAWDAVNLNSPVRLPEHTLHRLGSHRRTHTAQCFPQ